MAVSEIAVVRQFIRNRNRTTATTTSASTSTLSTLSIETSMNDAWRNSTSTVVMLFGSTRLRSAKRGLDLAGQLERVGVGLLLDASG